MLKERPVMIKCPFCQAVHVANTIFCDECGNYLVEGEKPETDPLDTLEIESTEEEPDDLEAILPAQSGVKPKAVQFKIGDRELEFRLPLQKPIQFGRVDPSSDTYPEIDLSDNGHASKSVSRRHARIFQQGNDLIIEDLASINGTFINRKRLDPYLPEILHDGDVLYLGKVCVEVKIVE